MIEINKSQEVQAPVEAVWRRVADLENEHKDWPFLRDVQILSRTDNSIEREVKIHRGGPMGEAKSVQILTVDPVENSTTLTLTNGPMLGKRKILLSRLSEGRTKIDVSWEFEMKGIPEFAKVFVKENVSEVTENALTQIAKEAGASSVSPGAPPEH